MTLVRNVAMSARICSAVRRGRRRMALFALISSGDSTV